MLSKNGDRLRVLVTGVGGGCGMGIMKALLQSKLNPEIYVADISPLAVGLHRSSWGSKVLPPPEQDIGAWYDYALGNEIDAIILGSDHDLEPFAQLANAWSSEGIKVIVSTLAAVRMANDKLATATALKEAGLDSPLSFGDGWYAHFYDNEIDFPIIVKPAFGMTSRGVHVAKTFEELDFYFDRTENAVVQEYLEGDEYTCALFLDRDHQLVTSFILKRDLYMGSTGRAYTVEDDSAEAVAINLFLSDFAVKMRNWEFVGDINLQLRLVPDRGPVVFEINARSSGSTAIRAGFGWNGPEMALRHFVLKEQIFPPRIHSGAALVFHDEAFLYGVTETELKGSNHGLSADIPCWLG